MSMFFFQILYEKKKMVESEEMTVISHGGICISVGIVVAAVWDLLNSPSPPLLLCLGSATRDKELVVSLAASYLGEVQLEILRIKSFSYIASNTCSIDNSNCSIFCVIW